MQLTNFTVPVPPAAYTIEGTSIGPGTVATFTDPAGAELLANYTATIDWGDGTGVHAGTGVNTGGNNFAIQDGTHVFAEEGNYTLTVTVTHETAATLTKTQNYTVSDPAVVLTAGANLTPTQNIATGLVVLGTFTDPGNIGQPSPEPLTEYDATVVWGDGKTSNTTDANPSIFIIQPNPANNLYFVEGTHTYANPQAAPGYTITTTVQHHSEVAPFNVDTTVNTQTAVVADQQIENLAVVALPAVVTQGVPPTLPAITGLATFTDPGNPTYAGAENPISYTATINWGDGNTDTVTLGGGGIVNTGGSNFEVNSPAHTYAGTGPFSVFVTVTKNSLAAVTSASATVIVDAIPVVTTQPTNETVNLGNPVTFTTAASGYPAPTVQWYVDAAPSFTGFVAIGGANSTTLTFTPAFTDNGSLYEAIFTNTTGSPGTLNNVPTNMVTLTVDTMPAVVTPPVSQTVTAGFSVSFTAAASGNPAPTVQWQQSTDGGNTFVNISGATSTTLTFTPAFAQNGYEYQAVFTNSVGSVTTPAATLTVDTLPVVTTQPTNQTVVLGNPVTFTAAASGNPAPTVQWYVDAAPDFTGFVAIGGAISPTLTFTPAVTDNGSLYQAIFTNNTLGPTATNNVPTNVVVLTVDTLPAVITPPASQTVTAGFPVTFTAAASGNPAPTVQWQQSTDGGNTFVNITGATSTTLTFTPTFAQNGYEYQAVFTNSVGSMTTPAATLTVDTLPVVTRQPTNQAVVLGNPVTFTAAASGNPTPTVQWYVNAAPGFTGYVAILGANSTTYTFTPTAAQNGNLYRGGVHQHHPWPDRDQ